MYMVTSFINLKTYQFIDYSFRDVRLGYVCMI